MNYKKKIMLATGVLASLTAPTSLIVSCGSSQSKVIDFGKMNPFQGGSSSGQGGPKGEVSSTRLNDKIQGTALANLSDISPYYGMWRKSDLSHAIREATMVTRKKTGQPIGEGLAPHDLWNWTPDAIKDTASITGPGKLWDYTPGAESTPTNEFHPGMVDAAFDRATIRKPAKRMLAPQLKETQGMFAQFKPTTLSRSIGTDIGMTAGQTQSSQFTNTQCLNYASLWGHWTPSYEFGLWFATWPSGGTIDISHKYGVPITGNIFFDRGNASYGDSMVTNPGPNGDYPAAKGLAEVANFYGFDGWWIDWEGPLANSKRKSDFIKALSSYQRTDQYTNSSGTTFKLSEFYGEQRKKYHYGPSLAGITGSYQDSPSGFGGAGDDYWNWQKHGGDAGQAAMYQDYASQFNKDRYWGNGASNWVDDGYSGALKNNYRYYKGGLDVNESGPHEKENSFSTWLFSDGMNDDSLNETLYHSYAKDPRVQDDHEHWAYGNSFRERTSVIGRKPFVTNFSAGRGKSFSLYGGKDIIDYVQGAGSTGWKHLSLQDVAPTYKWIVDTYDGDTQTNDITHLDGKHQVIRGAEPFLNHNTKNAYMYGTTLDFRTTGKGTWGATHSVETKLYASAIPVENGDKFKMIIKNNWKSESERIIPKLALWTVDEKVTPEYYKSDGTETDPTDSRYHLGFANRSSYLKYSKDVMAGKTETKTLVEHGLVNELPNGWLEVSYDLNQFANKTITEFGVRADNNTSDNNINNLSIGQMRFAPHDETKIKPVMKDFTTLKVWNNKSLYYQKARVEWKSFESDGSTYLDSAKIGQYITFVLDDKGNRTRIAWIGSTPAAYIDLISKTKSSIMLEVVAIDQSSDVVGSQIVDIPLTN